MSSLNRRDYVNQQANCVPDSWITGRNSAAGNIRSMMRNREINVTLSSHQGESPLNEPSHNEKTTVFRHPVTGQISPENTDFVVHEPANSRMSRLPPEQRTPSMVSESSTAVASSTVDATSGSKSSKPSGKIHSFGKRDHAIQRNPNMAVVVRGWLYKQDSSGMRLWKRKWFVLSDFCLFYYKDSREEVVLSSIPLPSYVIAPVEPEDHISRKYAFKASHTGMRSYIYSKNSVIGSQAEHGGMRTYYFSADTQEDMNGWIRAMNQAALMQSHSLKREALNVEKQAVPQTNHIISSRKGSAQAEGLHQSGWEEVPGGEPKQGREAEMRHGCSKELPEVQVSFPGDTDADLLPPEAGAPSRTSSGPHAQRNGLHADQNDSVVYKRGLVPRTDTEKEVQRKTALAQVEKWVKVQKGEVKSRASAEYTLPRRTPPMQPMPGMMEAYQSLPKPVRRPSGGSPPTARNMPSDYKYAQDRLSHFRMSMDERLANREGTVWQLYEWQQRQAFRHGSPTAPMFTATDSTDTAAFRVMLEVPRSVSVPPSPCDLPLPGGPCRLLSPRRPHTPADRVTVRPLDEARGVDVGVDVGVAGLGSPRRLVSKTAQTERRSMPSMGYITHTVSAPSLHGKTADDTYMHLKKDLEYLDLKVTGRDLLKDRPPRPFRIAESDVDVKLSRLCEQDKILQDLETRIHTLKVDKDKLESVLEVSRQQMEQYRDQPAHMEKIAYQQRLLQEDVVHIRADISQASTEMENAWSEYSQLECDVDRLRYALHEQMKRGGVSQEERSQLRKDLWQIEDVMAGLSTSKADYRLTVESVQNPERKLVPSASSPPVPSLSVGELKGAWLSPVQLLPHPSHLSHTPQKPEWVDEDAPPRPPLPHLYSPEEQPPEVPPLPRETSVIRHMSVRGLKRQSDERKRDREIGQYTNGDNRVELRTFLSEPELAIVGGPSGHDGGYQTLPSRGLTGSSSRLTQSTSVSSYVTLRRGSTTSCLKERPKSALERLYPGEPAPTRGRMSAEEQLERMKRHQRALVRERKRTLSQSERQAASSRAASSSLRPVSADLGSWRREQEFDLQLLERSMQGEERTPPEQRERPRSRSDEWLTSRSSPLHQLDLEPLDYQLDLSKELATPQKVTIPERYVDWESEELPSPQEMEARQRKAERIKSILAKSSVQNMPLVVAADKAVPSDLDFTLQEQERMITMSYALASEASLKSKQVAAKALSGR
ncbi:pleckstrin homology domain-containing family A member 7 isoform X3 [Electrophorus electricus]|uniref:pleckstrin homology domain-containing family A member 7 isoform X3 n=2 Tax=Electrophorus electricus TaxID=8005 RepID=UPI0015D09C41|nr:pleckstrin homology domain-containing family A member 7 isoform X3 [Electrophorus electricus]